MDKPINRIYMLTIMGFALFSTITSGAPDISKRAGRLMFDYNWPEPDPSVNKIPHEKSCHHFYLVLSEDDVSVERCPDGQHFDYMVHTCSPKEIARCWSHHFENKLHSRHPLRKHFKCPYTFGKYPDVHDCRKYFSCISSKPKHKKCAPFEKFDKILGKCVGEIYAVCADKSDVIEHDYFCPKPWGLFVFSKHCSKYYECLENKPILRTCPTDDLFHEHKRRCVPKDHAKCGSRYNPYENVDETRFQLMTSTLTPFDESSKTDVRYFSTYRQVQSTNIPSKDNEQQPTTESNDIKEIKQDFSTEIIEPPTRISEISAEETSRVEFKGSSIGDIFFKEITGILEISSQQPIKNAEGEFIQPSTAVETLKEKDGRISTVTETAGTAGDSGIEFSKNSELSTSAPNSQGTDVSDVSKQTDIHISGISMSTTTHEEIATDSSSMSKNNQSQSATSFTDVIPEKRCPPGDETCVIDKTGGVVKCPSATGVYPHPRDESRYLQCDNYKIQVGKCSPGQIFDASEKKCRNSVILL